MAYLGRISAVLTASTRDFTREIGTARRELQNFAQQARGIQLNLDTRALNGTLTNLQRFRRTLEEIQRLQASGVGAGLPNVSRLRDQFRIFEDLGRPLTDVKNQIEGLSNSIQTELYPELERIQGGFRNLYRRIGEGATTFDQQGAAVEALQRRLINLRNAAAAVGDLSKLSSTLGANNVGASFSQPRAKASLQRTIELRNDAQKVPVGFRDSAVFAQLTAEAEQNANAIEQAAARVARANLRIQNSRRPTPAMLEDRGAQQESLDRLTGRQDVINAQFQRELRSASIRQIVSPEAESQVDSLIESAAKLSERLRESNNTRFEPLIQSVGRVIEQLNRGEVSARRAKQAVDALAGADFSRAFAASGFKDADKVLRTDSERTISDIRQNAAAERAGVIGKVGAIGLIGPQRMRQIGEINRRENISLDREEFNRSVVGRFESLGSRTKQLKDAGLSQRFDEIRRLAQDSNASIQSAFNERDPQMAAAAIDAYRLKVAATAAEIDKFERALTSAETANKRFAQFLEISGSRSDKLGADLERAASDIAVLRQAIGNFESGNISGRRSGSAEIERQLDVYKRAAELQQRIADKSFKSEETRARALQRVSRVIAWERERGIEKVAQASTMDGSAGVGADVLRARAERAAKNRGSFGIAGAASAQLAFQQGLFAIDDFVSSTGGFEYKLRAIGNNITQLGLLLGQSGLIKGLTATTGLFIGLGAVLAGQALLGIYKWIQAGVDSESRTAALNAALQKQKSIVDELAQSFRSLGEAISRDAFSKPAESGRQFGRQIEEIAKKQKELREGRIADLDQDVQQERAVQKSLRDRLDASSSPGERVALQARISASEARERVARNNAPFPRPDAESVIDAIAASRGRFAGSGGEEFRRRFAGADLDTATSELEARIAELVPKAGTGFFSTASNRQAAQDLAVLQKLLEQIRNFGINAELDKRANDVASALDQAARDIGQAQESVSGAIERGVPNAGVLRSKLDVYAKNLEDAGRQLAEATKITDEKKRSVEVKKSEDRVATLRQERDALEKEADELARRRGFGGRRLTDATSALDQNQSLRNGFANTIGFLERRAQDEAIARRNLDRATEDRVAGRGTKEQEDAARKELERVQRANEELAQFVENIISASNALKDIRGVLEDSVQESQQRVDELQRELNDNKPESLGGRSRERVKKERDEAIANRIEDERRARVLNADLAFRESELANSQPVAEINKQLNTLAGIRDQVLENARVDGVMSPESAEYLRRLQAREAELLAERERIYREGTQAERDAIDEQARLVAERRNLAESVARGRELTLTPAQRAARDFGQSIVDIRANAADEAKNGNANAAGAARDAINREFEQRARQVAPTLMGFRDERLNAALQGPSRQALNVSDVQTMEGARELNRLLRGDDPAKDVNLQELKEQTRLLDGLLQEAKNRGEVVELRG